MTIHIACMTMFALVASSCASGGGGAPASPFDPYTVSGGGYEGGGGVAPAYTMPAQSMPPAPAAMEDMDCAGTAPTYQQVTAFAKCATCHSSTKSGVDRRYAPASVNFDTRAGAESNAQSAVSMVKTGQMPPAASGLTLTDAEKRQLYDWAMCAD